MGCAESKKQNEAPSKKEAEVSLNPSPMSFTDLCLDPIMVSAEVHQPAPEQVIPLAARTVEWEGGSGSGDFGGADDRSEKLFSSASKIQKLVRKKSSQKKLRQQQEWKIFSDIDLQDEAQMLMLANFMQALLDTNLSAHNDTPNQVLNMPVKESTFSSPSEALLCVDDINVSMGDLNASRMSGKNMMNYSLPKGPISPEVVKDIIELYKKGGKLSPLSLQNILRQAYKSLKTESNIRKTTISGQEKLAVVGDLHGQVRDLFFILDENGMPSTTNKYVFNGDFVDRGTSGVEVLVVLLSLYCAFPGCVALNRGNHEDYAVCCIYGFQTECCSKYDDIYFGMFCELFNYMPVCSIVNDSVFIIHGGLFHEPDATLADLEDIDRKNYKVCTDSLDGGAPRLANRSDYLHRLFRDALWSDPHSEDTLLPNSRGSGVLFGPAHTRKFLSRNKLNMVIRSHECVRGGVAFPFYGEEDGEILATVFSASNYGGSGNQAAYIVLTTHAMSDSRPVPGSQLYFKVQSFSTSLIKQTSLETKNRMSLKELLCRRKRALQLYFESKDVSGSGLISKFEWAEQMQSVTGIKILWIPLIPTIMTAECIEGAYIRYNCFLESLSISEPGSENFKSENDISSLYGPVEQLDLIFKFFDRDGNGQISRTEFKIGCEYLNSRLPPESQFKEIDQILNLIDLDGSDSIDKNELFEMFRHLDAKDGVVDGVISVASKYTVSPSPQK